MTKNKLTDLNDHLFAQLERLSDEDLNEGQIDTEVKRAEAIVKVADRIVDGADLQLRAAKLFAEHGAYIEKRLPLIGKGIGGEGQ
ncbi:hypothetical protein [Microbaculum marinisediminis]|uniref:Phage protein n=1 Tax=Microbaculum marinisediminis TaxID=2931392 RepID=A0AAW5QUM5_9HYPH|nr:hypothetical protein [Microbaculum sp. A6E488]MCT8970604.1 hypothetical protein [Microbaculum sp. A6E488]